MILHLSCTLLAKSYFAHAGTGMQFLPRHSRGQRCVGTMQLQEAGPFGAATANLSAAGERGVFWWAVVQDGGEGFACTSIA